MELQQTYEALPRMTLFVPMTADTIAYANGRYLFACAPAVRLGPIHQTNSIE